MPESDSETTRIGTSDDMEALLRQLEQLQLPALEELQVLERTLPALERKLPALEKLQVLERASVAREKLQALEQKLRAHIQEARVVRERVEKAVAVLDTVMEFFRDARRASHELREVPQLRADAAGSEVAEETGTASEPRPKLNRSVARSVIGLAGVLVVGLVMPTRVLPSPFVQIFDVFVFLGIAAFGWAALIAAFRERHRILAAENSRR